MPAGSLAALRKLGLWLTLEKALEGWKPKFSAVEAAQYLKPRVKAKEAAFLGLEGLLQTRPRWTSEELLREAEDRLPLISAQSHSPGRFWSFGMPGEPFRGSKLLSARPKYSEDLLTIPSPAPSETTVDIDWRPRHFDHLNELTLLDLRRRAGEFNRSPASLVDEWQSTWHQGRRGWLKKLAGEEYPAGTEPTPPFPLGDDYDVSRLARIHALQLASRDPALEYFAWSRPEDIVRRYNLGEWFDRLRLQKSPGFGDTHNYFVRPVGSKTFHPVAQVHSFSSVAKLRELLPHLDEESAQRFVESAPIGGDTFMEIPKPQYSGKTWPIPLYRDEPVAFFKKLGVPVESSKFFSGERRWSVSKKRQAAHDRAVSLHRQLNTTRRNVRYYSQNLQRVLAQLGQGESAVREGYKQRLADAEERYQEIKRALDSALQTSRFLRVNRRKTLQGVTRNAYAIQLTPELRREVLEKGFSLFSLLAALQAARREESKEGTP